MTDSVLNTTVAPVAIDPPMMYGTDQRISMLIHGPSKMGKSTLSSTAPKPVLVLDAEGSWRFIPVRKVFWDPTTGGPPIYDGTWDACIVNVRDWQTVQLVYNWLTQYITPFVSVVIDSITEIQRRCFTPDTELLTPTGWVRIDEIKQGDAIAQYFSDTGAISFTNALDVQRLPHNGDLVRVKTTFSDLAVTPDHRMLVRTDGGFTNERTANELRVGLRIPVAGVATYGNDPGMSDDEIRLLAAIQADSYQATTNVFAFNLKKRRKQERLAQLCESTGTRYRRLPGREPEWEHFRVFRSPSIDKWVSEKTFRWEMLDWPEHQRRVFLEELGQWDGSVGSRGIFYSTTNDTNAEIVSALAVITGYGVRTTKSFTRIGTPYHLMHLSDYSWRRMSDARMISREHYKGDVHCVTVPSGFVVTRRSGKTTIAGNCKANLVGSEQMKMQDWGSLLMQMDTVIRGFRDLALVPALNTRCVVFIAETRQSNGSGKWVPYMQGQISVSLPYWVDLCGHLYPDWELDANQQPTREVRRLWIGPHPQYESGERVQGRLGNCQTIIKTDGHWVGNDITNWMNIVFDVQPVASTVASNTIEGV